MPPHPDTGQCSSPDISARKCCGRAGVGEEGRTEVSSLSSPRPFSVLVTTNEVTTPTSRHSLIHCTCQLALEMELESTKC